jgi:F-type H+-transporting ATPase subunit alpha
MIVVVLYALNKGYMDEIPASQITAYEDALKDTFKKNEAKLLNDIKKEGQLTNTIENELDRAISNFTINWNEKEGEI